MASRILYLCFVILLASCQAQDPGRCEEDTLVILWKFFDTEVKQIIETESVKNLFERGKQRVKESAADEEVVQVVNELIDGFVMVLTDDIMAENLGSAIQHLLSDKLIREDTLAEIQRKEGYAIEVLSKNKDEVDASCKHLEKFLDDKDLPVFLNVMQHSVDKFVSAGTKNMGVVMNLLPYISALTVKKMTGDMAKSVLSSGVEKGKKAVKAADQTMKTLRARPQGWRRR